MAKVRTKAKIMTKLLSLKDLLETLDKEELEYLKKSEEQGLKEIESLEKEERPKIPKDEKRKEVIEVIKHHQQIHGRTIKNMKRRTKKNIRLIEKKLESLNH